LLHLLVDHSVRVCRENMRLAVVVSVESSDLGRTGVAWPQDSRILTDTHAAKGLELIALALEIACYRTRIWGERAVPDVIRRRLGIFRR
jgi:hypothetical protein